MKPISKRWIIYSVMFSSMLTSMTACNNPQEPTPSAAPFISEVTDSEITMKVKGALAENEILRPFHIDVVATNGDVALTGVVNSQSQIDLATEITRKINGVHTIHEHMTKS